MARLLKCKKTDKKCKCRCVQMVKVEGVFLCECKSCKKTHWCCNQWYEDAKKIVEDE